MPRFPKVTQGDMVGEDGVLFIQAKKSGNRQCSSRISKRRHVCQIPSSEKKPSKSAFWEWLVSYHILP